VGSSGFRDDAGDAQGKNSYDGERDDEDHLRIGSFKAWSGILSGIVSKRNRLRASLEVDGKAYMADENLRSGLSRTPGKFVFGKLSRCPLLWYVDDRTTVTHLNSMGINRLS